MSEENSRPGNDGNGNLHNLIVLRGEREEPRFVHTVRQADLVELQYLSRLFTEARAAWEEKREWTKAALRAGAGVEAGLLVAELVPRHRPGHQVADCDYDELVVR